MGVFGKARGQMLCQRLTEKSAKIEAELAAGGAPVHDLVSRAAEEREDDTELLIGIRDPAMPRPGQRRYIEAMAFAAARTLKDLGESVTARVIVENADKAKGALASLSSEYGPTLTEDTWNRILALDDVGELSFCRALLLGDSNEIHIAHTRRALLENATLPHYAMAIARDERRLSELQAEFETASKS